jgi:hypothetical protein
MGEMLPAKIYFSTNAPQLFTVGAEKMRFIQKLFVHQSPPF